MDRRRSQRIPLSIPLNVLSLDPYLLFRERCHTIDVSYQGCQFIAHRSLPHNARIRLINLSSFGITAACVVRSIPILPGPQVDTWYVAIELVTPGNFWDVESPPPDWVGTA